MRTGFVRDRMMSSLGTATLLTSVLIVGLGDAPAVEAGSPLA